MIPRSDFFGPVGTLIALSAVVAGCASAPTQRSSAPLSVRTNTTSAPTAAARAALQASTAQVIAAERAFASSMADRNFKNFLSHLSPDAIFFNGSMVEHGAAEIAAVWAPYFEGRVAPFSWQPDDVELLPDGKLALSTGPLLQQGKIVGRFNSIWRLEAPNSWKIIFDKGEAVCSAPPPTTNSNGDQFFQAPPQNPQ